MFQCYDDKIRLVTQHCLNKNIFKKKKGVLFNLLCVFDKLLLLALSNFNLFIYLFMYLLDKE